MKYIFVISVISQIGQYIAVTYSAFNFTKLKPRYFYKLSVVLIMSVVHLKSSLEFSKLLASCHHAYMACRQFAVNVTSLLFFNVYSYNFVNSWNSVCSPDINSVHIRFQWQVMTANYQVKNNTCSALICSIY